MGRVSRRTRSDVKRHMLFLGFGFTAQALARRLDRSNWQITASARRPDSVAGIESLGVEAVLFDALEDIPRSVTHLVSSIAPDEAGDAVIRQLGSALESRARQLAWAGYLSTTGVYGDHAGGLVDEDTPLTPNTVRGERRLAAERQWQRLHSEHGLPLHIFRLAGIYGPGRNALANLRAGTARRVVKPGQIFSRIHVDDIAGVLAASIARPNPGRAYNVADDEPCPPQDVVAHAAQLLGIAPPPEVPFAEASMSAMAKSFFADSKRVSNSRIKEELGYRLLYPSYREGLAALL